MHLSYAQKIMRVCLIINGGSAPRRSGFVVIGDIFCGIVISRVSFESIISQILKLKNRVVASLANYHRSDNHHETHSLILDSILVCVW